MAIITAIAAAAIFTLAIMTTAFLSASPPLAAATTTTATTTATTTTSSSQEASAMIELSPEPVYQELARPEAESFTPINETHMQTTYTANGTLNLPNATETIRVIANGSGITSIIDSTFAGKQILTTEDGRESATATLYQIVRFGEQQGRGIVMAVFDTNSTGALAPLDGMILVGIDEFAPDGTRRLTMWEWQSGIPIPTGTNTIATTPTEEPSPLTETTTTTNATTTADDTNAATATAPTDEVEGEEQLQQQQQQSTPTVPPAPAPNPLFE
jgi:hypothetical protein